MSQETKTVVLNIDRNLANNFKSAAAKRGDKMSDVLIPVVVEAMKKYLLKAEQESAAIQKNADEMIAKIT